MTDSGYLLMGHIHGASQEVVWCPSMITSLAWWCEEATTMARAQNAALTPASKAKCGDTVGREVWVTGAGVVSGDAVDNKLSGDDGDVNFLRHKFRY